MNNKKFQILSIVALVLPFVMFLIGFLVMFLPTNVVETFSLFEIVKNRGTHNMSDEIYYAALALNAVFYLGIVFVLSNIYSFIKRNSSAFYACVVYFLIFSISLIAVHLIFTGGIFTLTSLILIGLNILLSFALMGLTITRKNILSECDPYEDIEVLKEDTKDIEYKERKKLSIKNLSIGLLIYNTIIVLSLVALFFMPIYTMYSTSGEPTSFYLYQEFNILTNFSERSVIFIVFLVLSILSLLYYIYSLSIFFSSKVKFAIVSKYLMIINVLISFSFFIVGFIISSYYSAKGTPCDTITFIYPIIIGLSTIVYAVLKGNIDYSSGRIPTIKPERKNTRIESLIYLTILTAASFVILALVVVSSTFTPEGGTPTTVSLSGLDLIQDYFQLGNGYQMLAFGVLGFLTISVILYLLSLFAFFSDYKQYKIFAKLASYTNFIGIIALCLTTFYLTIAQEMNMDDASAFFNYFGYEFNEDFTYTYSSQIIYLLLADLVIIALCITRKVFEVDNAIVVINESPLMDPSEEEKEEELSKEEPLEEVEEIKEKDLENGLLSNQGIVDDPLIMNQNPCPAFAQIDKLNSTFVSDLNNRKLSTTNNSNLSDLCQFVVDYAKNSRLHLSYTKESIATFVAGLGASKLSILQGMSGTGKTSLPKIFIEAIMGDCYIIEVESSWKDKNELLGYYNEFSKMYTPRKFTQALYKASLNKDIISFIVLDEMNLSRIEYYFSDFLSLMENEEHKRELKLLGIELNIVENGEVIPYLGLSEGNIIKIPSNVWFIGTANRDESTFVISDKVYDRAHTMNFNKRASKVRNFESPLQPRFYDINILKQLFEEALQKGTFDAEKSPLIQQIEVLLAPFNISFGNRILNQIENFVDIYVACFPEKDVINEAIETILLSKVVSKLEVKTIVNKDSLAKEFEHLHLSRCARFIMGLDED